nr:immunoglobulin light chain junction region [Macaca mulatta]MOX42180.1 immunoglobulin light chain junction region [Macaca mulatta]MOX42405.1 immunoglobulin light chain junction region [Macaca mulatta]MOX43140.1 immunoglobulin light chain junction region [Macaca mulatta]MOX46509.1 immunoglobulin light chain junction region [Macaca mulatta]
DFYCYSTDSSGNHYIF